MTIRFMAALGVAAALAGMAAAQGALGIFGETEEVELEGLNVRPGLYDVTITQTQSGYANGERIERPPQTQSGQMCIRPEGDLLRAEDFNRPGCEVDTRSVEVTGVYFSMSCNLGGQEMGGRWRIGVGHPTKISLERDYFVLPDGRMASSTFFVAGSLHSQEDEVSATLEVEQLFKYAGECPA
ncbi:hypothetical protein L53_01070 [Hyphomonas sp. L-53-1-40]|uniref:DUF3617 domain-containing protein n=1 Tax=unclassified Hyphomonas TaxID=2630699 RepID=UPI0004589B07|nr:MULTISPECIES: DUF3617 family protein [unclassified Hyphomonas]KCZ65931.1 hypothetical protein L53_01070 [Hyphomonas sp. L-53-1-40]